MPEVSEAVRAFISGVTPAKRRRDAETLLELMTRVTGESPRLWGTIVAFGQYHYKYKSGREGDSAPAAFSPRKTASTIYLVDGIASHTQQLQRLGRHTTGVGCLYIKDLDEVDLAVLETIVGDAYRTLTRDSTYTLRAREGGEGGQPNG